MGTASRIRWNSLFSFLSQFIRLGTNMVMFVGIARFYGAEAFGQFTTAHTYATLFFVIADFGFDLLLTTEIARDHSRGKELVEKLLPFKIVFSLFAVIGMFIIAFIVPMSDKTRLMMFVLSFGIVGNAFSNFSFALMKGYEELKHETRVSFFQNFILLVFLLVLGLLKVDLLFIAIVFVLSRFLGMIFMMKTIRKKFSINFSQFSFSGFKKTFYPALPYGVHLLFGVLYFQLDTILLSLWRTVSEVGMYQSVFKLVALVLVVPEVVINAFLPTLSRLHRESPDKWLFVGKLVMKILVFFGMPIGLIFFVYADKIIPIIYGGGFENAIPVMKVFAAIIVIRFSVETFALMLTTSQLQTVRMRIVIIATIINLLFNLYFIPHFGIMGAAFVSLATNIIAGILYIVTTRKLTFNFFISGHAIIIIFAILTILFSIILPLNPYNSVFIMIPIILFSYSLLYYFFGFTFQEKSILFSFNNVG